MTTTYQTNSYSNLSESARNNVYKLLSEDVTALIFENNASQSLSTMKVIDGSYSFEMKNFTFPLILVHSAIPKDDYYAFSTLVSDIDIEIEVFATREKTVRLIVDRIRALLQSSQSTTRTYGVEFYKSRVVGASSTIIDTRLVHTSTLIVNYRFYSLT